MLTIETINPGDKIFIDPYQYDLDGEGRHLRPVEGLDYIALDGEDVRTFLAWVSNSWREDFECDLQGLCEDADGRPLLTTSLPLVDFREDYCTRRPEGMDEATIQMLVELRDLTREWRGEGVDTVCISGYDARHSAPEPSAKVEPASSPAPLLDYLACAAGIALMLVGIMALSQEPGSDALLVLALGFPVGATLTWFGVHRINRYDRRAGRELDVFEMD